MRFLFILSFIFLPQITLKSQCSYISGILVNACGGSSEGINEVVTLQIGDTDVNWNNISITFPSDGIYCNTCTNKFTTNSTYVNNKLRSDCPDDIIVELGVTTNIIPAGSRVIIFTGSTPTYDFDFSNLCGTGPYYVMFANNTSTIGRYANSVNANRTTSYNINGCTGGATYYSSSANTGTDGDAVFFDSFGTPTYVNSCNAEVIINPVIPLFLHKNLYYKNTDKVLDKPIIIKTYDLYGKEVNTITTTGIYIIYYSNGDKIKYLYYE